MLGVLVFLPCVQGGVDYFNNDQWQVDWQDDDMKESCINFISAHCIERLFINTGEQG